MRRKFIALMTALVLVPAFLFAVPVVVTWEWLLEDPLVTTFRYQVDGEAEDEWIVVDSSVTSYTQRGMDGTLPHTLYLQQSYDGIHFSGSALSVAQPMFPPEPQVQVAQEPALPEEPSIAPEPAAQEVAAVQPVEEALLGSEEDQMPVEEVVQEAVVQEEEAVVVEEPATQEQVVEEVEPVLEVAAEPVVEEPVVPEAVVEQAPVEVVAAKKQPVESRYSTTISFGGTFNYQNPSIGTYARYNLQAVMGIQLNNLKTFNNALGLGVDFDLAYSPYLAAAYGWKAAAQDVLDFDFATPFGELTQAITISVAPMLNVSLGKLDFDLGIGGFMTWGPGFVSTDGRAFLAGAFAKAALEYHVNRTISMGASVKYGFILSEDARPQYVEGTAYLGFSF